LAQPSPQSRVFESLKGEGEKHGISRHLSAATKRHVGTREANVRILFWPPPALCSDALAAVGILGAALAAKSTF
jgi:hypothetical protein